MLEIPKNDANVDFDAFDLPQVDLEETKISEEEEDLGQGSEPDSPWVSDSEDCEYGLDESEVLGESEDPEDDDHDFGEEERSREEILKFMTANNISTEIPGVSEKEMRKYAAIIEEMKREGDIFLFLFFFNFFFQIFI